VLLAVGGTTVSVPVSLAFTLDGSDSVDLNQKSTETSDLTYDWVCLIITAGANYLDPCGIYDDDAGSQSVLVIAANEMDSIYVYQITLYVTATDGRSDSASVTVYPSGTTIQVGGMSGPSNSQVNFDQKLSVLGEITAAVEVNATWSVAWGTVDFPISLMTNALTSPSHEFSSSQAADGLQFSLGIAPNSFVSGRTYTFTLTGCEPGSTSLCSYSQLDVYINGPPTSGSIIISPEEGAALNTTFSMSAISWIDFSTDYPLQFSFLYQLSSTLPTMSIAGYSGNSYAESLLPAGLSNNNNTVSIIGLVADVFSCATSSTISVRVLDREISNAEIESLLETTVSSFGSTGDTDALFQTLNAASTTLNTINCSLATNCSGIFREDCVTTANTCGSCLYGYIGVVGDSNLPCFNMNLTSGEIGSLCGGPGDCIYGLCENIVDGTGTCTAPPLECVNNCTYHGQCEYVDAGNNLLSSCTIFDVGCSAVCLCDTDFHGQDCSLTEANLTSLDNSRASMCVSLLKAAKVQDNSSALLDTMVSALLQAYSPYQVVSEDAITSCASLLSYLSAVGRLGYIANAQSSTVQFLTNTMSSFVTGTQVQSQRRRRRLSSSNSTSTGNAVGTAVSDMITGLTSGILGGETPTSITSANLRVSVMSPLTSSLSNSSLSPPATAAQSQYGSLLPSVGLAGNGLDACGFSGGYSPLSIMSWGSNPYSTDVPLQSSILRFGTGGTTDSRRKMLETVDVALTFVPLFYISLQFSSKMDLNFTAQRLGLKANITLPQCRFYDGSEYTDCQGCNISSYTDYNVTYGCYDLSVLCSGASSTRHMARRLADGEGAASYAALAEAIAAELASVLSQNPFAIDLAKAKAILIFISFLIFTFFAGIFCTLPWDKFEHNQLVYLKEGKDSAEDEKEKAKEKKESLVDMIDKAFKVPIDFGASFAKKLSPRTPRTVRSDSYSGSGSGSASDLDVKVEDAFSIVDELDDDNASEDPWDTENMLSDHALKENVIKFLGVAIPSESVLCNDSFWTRSIRLLVRKHEWVDFFTSYNPELSRTIRWIGLWKGLLINLFIDTLFFGIYFADDGTCELFNTETNCLLLTSALSSTGTKCIWSGSTDDDGHCSLAPPPSDVMFTVVLALICVIICVPIDFMMSYCLEEFAAKWPDLDSLGMSTMYWYGSHKFPDFSKPEFASALSLFDKVQSDMSPYERQALSTLLYSDLHSPEEEIHSILATIHRVFCAETESPSYSSNSLEALGADKVARANAITENLGVYPNGELAPLSILRRLRHGTSSNFLVNKITRVRKNALLCTEALRSYEVYEKHFRDYFMVQSFILEHFTAFKRFALKKQLFFYKKIAPDIIPLYEYLLAWFFIFISMSFFFYWIFAWGVKNGGVTMEAWGINFAIGAAQDIFCQNPIKIFVLYVAAVEVMRPQLVNVHRTLYDVAMRAARSSPVDFGFRVCQHTSPTCRAARILDAYDLPSARLLRLVNDKDIQVCRQARITNELFIITMIIAVPALLAVMGDPVADQVLDVLLSTVLSGIAVFFSILQTYGEIIMCVPIIIIVSFVVYRYGLLNRALKYMSQQEGAEKRQLKHFRASRDHRSSMPWVRRQIRRAWLSCIDWFLFLSRPKDSFEEVVFNKSGKLRRTNVWQHMNVPPASSGPADNSVREGESDGEGSGTEGNNVSNVSDPLSNLIPEEILALVPNVLPAYETVGRLGEVRDLRVTTPGSATAQVKNLRKPVVSEIPTVTRNSQSEVKGVTRHVDVALKSLLSVLIEDIRFIDDLLADDDDEVQCPMHNFAHASGAGSSELISASKLGLLFQQVWVLFWPAGVKLSAGEVQRVCEYFNTWIAAMQEDTSLLVGLIPVRAFIFWFRRLNQYIVRLRTQERVPRQSGPVRRAGDGGEARISVVNSVDEYFFRLEDADSSEEGSNRDSSDNSSDSSDAHFFSMFLDTAAVSRGYAANNEVANVDDVGVEGLESFYVRNNSNSELFTFSNVNQSVYEHRTPSKPASTNQGAAKRAVRFADTNASNFRMEVDNDDSSEGSIDGSSDSSNNEFYKSFMGTESLGFAANSGGGAHNIDVDEESDDDHDFYKSFMGNDSGVTVGSNYMHPEHQEYTYDDDDIDIDAVHTPNSPVHSTPMSPMQMQQIYGLQSGSSFRQYGTNSYGNTDQAQLDNAHSSSSSASNMKSILKKVKGQT
jgi:hypothetical protein